MSMETDFCYGETFSRSPFVFTGGKKDEFKSVIL